MIQTPETDAIRAICDRKSPEEALSEMTKHAKRLEIERDRAKKSERITAANAMIAEKSSQDMRKLVDQMQERIAEMERFMV